MSIFIGSVEQVDFFKNIIRQEQPVPEHIPVQQEEESDRKDEEQQVSDYRHQFVNFDSVDRREQGGSLTVGTPDRDQAEFSSLGMQQFRNSRIPENTITLK